MEEPDPVILNQLRSMARRGDSVPRILRELLRQLGPEQPHKINVIRYIRGAFALTLRQASPIAGWAPDGSGELQDAQLDLLVRPEIVKNQQEWDNLGMASSA